MSAHAARSPADSGSVGLLTAIVACVCASIGMFTLIVVIDLAATAGRARTAADAAALAAMAASPLAGGDGDHDAAARTLAGANGAQLVRCCGEQLMDVELTVAMPPATAPLRRLLPSVTARGAATLVPPPQHEIDRLRSAGAGPVGDPSTARLARPVSASVTSHYGWRTHPIAGDRRLHAGTDFGARRGTEIVAAADGLVAAAGNRGGYGRTVDIDHGNGLLTRYAHQSVILVRTGQRVRRGDVIGRVGSTGNSTGAHLHFEVRVNGRPRNPMHHL